MAYSDDNDKRSIMAQSLLDKKFNEMEESKKLEQNLDKSNEKLHISDVIKRTWCFNAVKRNEPDEYKISIYLKAIDRVCAEKQFEIAFPDLEWKERYLKTRM